MTTMTVKPQVWNQALRISLPKYPERRTIYPSASYLHSPSEDQVSPEWQSQNMAGLAHGDKQYLTATSPSSTEQSPTSTPRTPGPSPRVSPPRRSEPPRLPQPPPGSP
ncbi:uncharacterized protein CLUP02_14623 [Colletotrichum lupini]|uniref:Uncharacterized protein n=1 Tax=Colletotrichum lupini TaxID=145971 RepID=A0A9Q8T5B8_9PEZI|nr:uncharacterized protein CLUP02_14623 [Colletotrichum lupini]UQC89095.1 hypothetical protein CLUP02_14623 [Colletotrichum lupini]